MKRLDMLKDYRSMSEKELQALVTDLRLKIVKLKTAIKNGEEKNTSSLGQLKKSLARALSITTENSKSEKTKKGSEE